MKIYDFRKEIDQIRNMLGLTALDFGNGLYIPTHRKAIDLSSAVFSDGTYVFDEMMEIRNERMDIENINGDILVSANDVTKLSKTPYYPIAPALLIVEILKIAQYYRASDVNIINKNPLSDTFGPLINCVCVTGNRHDDIIFAIQYIYPNCEVTDGLLHILYSVINAVDFNPDYVYDLNYDGIFLQVRNLGEPKSLRFDELYIENR
jgi:hypothetical protein